MSYGAQRHNLTWPPDPGTGCLPCGLNTLSFLGKDAATTAVSRWVKLVPGITVKPDCSCKSTLVGTGTPILAEAPGYGYLMH